MYLYTPVNKGWMDVSLGKAEKHLAIQILIFPKQELQYFLCSKKRFTQKIAN